MAKTYSIFTDDFDTCYLTDSMVWIEPHHIFYGRGMRPLSAKHGLVIPVQHHYHNEPPYGIHHNADLDLMIKQYAQRKFEDMGNTREEFMLIFGRNYLYDENDGYEISLPKLGIPCYLD